MPLYLELFLRFSSIGILMAICAVILANGLRPRAVVYALTFNLAAICMLLVQGSSDWRVSGEIGILFHIIANLIFVFAWRFGMAILDEDVSHGPLLWSVVIFSMFAPLLNYFERKGWIPFAVPDESLLQLMYLFVSVSLIAHLAYRSYAGYKNDLSEVRRKYRVPFSLLLLCIMFVIFTGYLLDYSEEIFDYEFDTKYLLILGPGLAIVILLWIARLNPETLGFVPIKKVTQTQKGFETRDEVLLRSLNSLMEMEYVYREHGLTVTKLADKMGLQERKLRDLINGTLGYSNFSNFLNAYRIEEAKGRLADPQNEQVPVLTIALDVGFASISPFNVAFKSFVGVSPTKYRQITLKTGDQIDANFA